MEIELEEETLSAIFNELLLLCRLREISPDTLHEFRNMVMDRDLEWELAWELRVHTFDHYFNDYLDDYGNAKEFFSDSSMIEFYRLCRTHASLHSMKLKEDPFYVHAEDFVDEVMRSIEDDPYGYGYGWTLLTKINHECASGLIIYTSDGFSQYTSMSLEISVIPDYYRSQCTVLRKEIAKCQREKLRTSKTKERKKAA